MTTRYRRNHLKKHRRSSGLSQREVGVLIGYGSQWQVSRHELAQTDPPLRVALAYEVVFRIPVSTLFTDSYADAIQKVEASLAELESRLQHVNETGCESKNTIRKLAWLAERLRTKTMMA
jgi:DNA-binding XRE family transcriptional regulator